MLLPSPTQPMEMQPVIITETQKLGILTFRLFHLPVGQGAAAIA